MEIKAGCFINVLVNGQSNVGNYETLCSRVRVICRNLIGHGKFFYMDFKITVPDPEKVDTFL